MGAGSCGAAIRNLLSFRWRLSLKLMGALLLLREVLL